MYLCKKNYLHRIISKKEGELGYESILQRTGILDYEKKSPKGIVGFRTYRVKYGYQ